jgi:hypothetical protein
VIASGTGLVTLSEETLEVQFAVPAGQPSFTLGVFDGDGGQVDGAGKRNWDLGNDIPYSYTLYADPLRDGSGMMIVDMSPGVPVTSSASMPSNAWIDYNISTSADAQAPSGNFFYRLEIKLLNNSVSSFNAFKLRTNGVVSIRLADQPFSYIASLNNVDDRAIVYPSFPSLTPTTYNGTFRFFFDVPTPLAGISVWDGDFDYGDSTGLLTRDTDDPDTPNDVFPPWSTTDSVLEGVATGLLLSTGNPPDDLNPLAAVFLRPPSIFEELIFPDGQVFTNANPSGNQEWEQFRVSTDSGDPLGLDDLTSSIPAGTYELRIQGADLSNLNALRLPSEALCVSEAFEPCTALRPFLITGSVLSTATRRTITSPGWPASPSSCSTSSATWSPRRSPTPRVPIPSPSRPGPTPSRSPTPTSSPAVPSMASPTRWGPPRPWTWSTTTPRPTSASAAASAASATSSGRTTTTTESRIRASRGFRMSSSSWWMKTAS